VRELEERRRRGRPAGADKRDAAEMAFVYSLPPDPRDQQATQGFAVPPALSPSAASVTVTPLHSLLLMRQPQWRDEAEEAAAAASAAEAVGADASQESDPNLGQAGLEAKAAQLRSLLPDLIRRPEADGADSSAAVADDSDASAASGLAA
jgi:hypothetical protein